MKKWLVKSLVVLCVFMSAVTGVLIYLRFSVGRSPIGFFSPHDADTLISEAEAARNIVVQNKRCSFTIDQSSLGNKQQEAEMLYIASMLDLYRARFGVAARTMSDLLKLNEISKSDWNRWNKTCYFYVDSSSASVVTCGRNLPSDAELTQLARRLDPIQRFYKIKDAEVLYIPTPRC
jgi:hypothetical protein